MKIEEMIAVMSGWNGKNDSTSNLEYKLKSNHDIFWLISYNPEWSWDNTDYRIKSKYTQEEQFIMDSWNHKLNSECNIEYKTIINGYWEQLYPTWLSDANFELNFRFDYYIYRVKPKYTPEQKEIMSEWNGESGLECNIEQKQHESDEWRRYKGETERPQWLWDYRDYRVRPKYTTEQQSIMNSWNEKKDDTSNLEFRFKRLGSDAIWILASFYPSWDWDRVDYQIRYTLEQQVVMDAYNGLKAGSNLEIKSIDDDKWGIHIIHDGMGWFWNKYNYRISPILDIEQEKILSLWNHMPTKYSNLERKLINSKSWYLVGNYSDVLDFDSYDYRIREIYTTEQQLVMDSFCELANNESNIEWKLNLLSDNEWRTLIYEDKLIINWDWKQYTFRIKSKYIPYDTDLTWLIGKIVICIASDVLLKYMIIGVSKDNVLIANNAYTIAELLEIHL